MSFDRKRFLGFAAALALLAAPALAADGDIESQPGYVDKTIFTSNPKRS